MNSQINDAGRLRHRKAPASHLTQGPGYEKACGSAAGGFHSHPPRPPRPQYLRQQHQQYSSSPSMSATSSSSACHFHSSLEMSSHARSQSYPNPYQQQPVPSGSNSQRHNRPNRPAHSQQSQHLHNSESCSSENMAPRFPSHRSNHGSPTLTQQQEEEQQQPSILKLTSVLTTIATLPGRRVARAAKKLYSYQRNSISDSDLSNGITGKTSGTTAGARNKRTSGSYPGTPPPDYDSAMDGEGEDSSNYDSFDKPDDGEIERRPDSRMMSEDSNEEILRKYVKQGHHMLTLSLAEIDSNAPNSSSALTFDRNNSASNSSSFALTRQLYVHSLTYLLRALPQSLTVDEVSGITSALPLSVVDSITYQESLQNHHGNHCCCSHHVVEIPPPTPPKHPTLYKLAMLSTSSMVTLMRTMTPHLKVLILQLWLFCQRHRLVERGVEMLKSCGDMGVWTGGAVLEWLDIQGLLMDAAGVGSSTVQTQTRTQSQTEMEVHGSVDEGAEGGVVVTGAVSRSSNTTVRRRIVTGGAQAGGKVIRDMGSWMGGVVSSGVSGVVDGLSAGMEKPL